MKTYIFEIEASKIDLISLAPSSGVWTPGLVYRTQHLRENKIYSYNDDSGVPSYDRIERFIFHHVSPDKIKLLDL